jgi:hypothetical protein
MNRPAQSKEKTPEILSPGSRCPCWTRRWPGEGSFSRMPRRAISRSPSPGGSIDWRCGRRRWPRLGASPRESMPPGRQQDPAPWGGGAPLPSFPGGRLAPCRLGSLDAFRWQREPVERALVSWPRAPYLPGMRCVWRTRLHQTCGISRPAEACAVHGRRPSPGKTSLTGNPNAALP